MRISEIIEGTHPCFSFEFFPPKTPEGEQQLWATLGVLKELEPDFVSVTYGAGGSTRERTVEIVSRVKRELGIEAMAHLTCVGATVEQLREVLAEIQAAGIENVLALRGDPPQGETEWKATPGGLAYATELAGLISGEFGELGIGGACFPEVHPEAPDMETDLVWLKQKVDAGARFLITQLFFDNQLYFDFVPKARAAGIGVPIIPGVMPIRSYAQIKRFAALCGASIPTPLATALEALRGDEKAEFELGAAFAAQQCFELLSRGAPGIHFYTLNRPEATRAILAALRSARPWERSGATTGAAATAG